MLNVSIFGNRADIYVIVHLVPHAYQHNTVDQSHSSGDTIAKTQTAFIPKFRIPLLDTVENKCCLLEFCSKSSLYSHNGRGSCLFQNTKWLLKFTERHICYYCLLAANQGNYVCELFLKKTWRVSLSIGVRITMIRWVVYLLRIFKTFHGLMNNPVFGPKRDEVTGECRKLYNEELNL